MPVFRSIAYSCCGAELFRPSAISVITSHPAFISHVCSQILQEVFLDAIQDNEQRLLVSGLGSLLIRLFFIYVLDGDIVVLCYELYSLPKRKVLLFHDKGNGITATVTTETVEKIPMGSHGK